MKLVTCAMTALMCNFTHAAIEPHIQNYLNHAEQQQLDQQVTWQRLMYPDQAKKARWYIKVISTLKMAKQI